MSSPSAEAPVWLGEQAPRVAWWPEYASSAGEEAIELCEMAGLFLDPWQQLVVIHGLGEKEDHTWSATEVGVEVPRQNGKGGILEARELAGLYLLNERLIVHSAHMFDTSLEAFRRLLGLVEGTPELAARVRKVSHAHGEEGIELKGGQRIRFRTRTKGGGRGFSADCVILDEAMVISEAMHAALLPTLSARPNPQVWYTGSAVDQQEMEHGVVFARVRERGTAGGDPALAWFEWSAAESLEELKADPGIATDVRAWERANPALGVRITTDFVAGEQRSMSARKFAVERLGVGDWPRTDGEEDRLIAKDDWAACADSASRIAGPPAFAVDVTPDRSWGSIAVAGAREDGLPHVELVEHRPGTDWIVGRCGELQKAHRKAPVVIDKGGPAASLVAELLLAKIVILEPTSADYAKACGTTFDAVVTHRLRYPSPQPELDSAVEIVKTRPVGDGWAWGRRQTTGDISPLVAATLAFWGHTQRRKREPRIISLND